MSGAEHLFDTNAFIAWSKGDSDLARSIGSIQTPFLSIISLGELILGAKKSGRSRENLTDLRRRILDFRLISPDSATADVYGDILLALRQKGRPIPTNDVWIAATAVQHGLTLVSRDAHFQQVDGIPVLRW